ncbi:hypothetical protein [Burkholderia pseudomultivorans]|uniref:hypothetical protein n=1 Tax=Burkholderia pseudomultivorans TaxID=1207504 RepID=UPI000B1C708C|nr:hypothetical protein [Burkholderia pseudomultivorans]
MKPAKVAVGLVGGLLVLTGFAVAGQFAGATLFAQLEKLPDSTIGITTLYRYWIAFGHIVAVKRALVASTAVAALVTSLPLLIVVVFIIRGSRRVELHGSARFATVHEIRKAGLVEGGK